MSQADLGFQDTDGQEIDDPEVIDDAAVDDEVAPIQYDISSYGADYDVEGLVKRLDREDILIPPFQRNYVWRLQEASRFIESLLLGLPVPGIFLAREVESNKLLVIDGQQRLKTLQFFYNGYFNPSEDEDKRQVFKLVKVQPKFEGLTYKTLSDRDRIKLNDSLIHATIIKQDSPTDDDTSVYHIFDRLNSEGRRLTPQEIRTAIDHGPFIDLIKSLNDHSNWRNIYGKKNARLKDQELILRFLALYFERDNYAQPMDEFLNKFCRKKYNRDPKFLEVCRDLFTNTIDFIFVSLGRKAFRPERSFNTAVFDSVMVGLAHRLSRDSNADVQAFRDAYASLIEDTEYAQLISRATANERNIESRIRKAIDSFNGI